jgi:hypothetical protein
VSASLAALVNHPRNPLRRYVQQPAGRWGGMSPPQREFHTSQARKRFCLWANSMGKTWSGGVEAWWHLTDTHPFRSTPNITGEGWMLADDLQQGWKSVCKAMRAMEPPGVVDPTCHYDPERGYRWCGKPMLLLKNGRRMVGKGGSQTAKATEGDKIDWLWVDEPPKRSHWNGCVSRVNRTYGPIWVTMTAVAVSKSEGIEWLRDMVDGDPDKGKPPEQGRWPKDADGWDFLQRGMNYRSAPHLTKQQVDALIRDCDAWERAQRVHAKWRGTVAGRWVPAFDADHIFSDMSFEGGDVVSIGLGADYGEKPGNTIWYIGLYTRSGKVFILGEWSPDERMTEAQEAKGVYEALVKPLGISLHDIDVARGDSNSAGHRGIALSVNELLMRHFAGLTRSNTPPFDIRPPYKGPGSVRARARMLNTACAEGRFFVHETCYRLIDTLTRWMGHNDDLKHAFDAAGYLSEVWLAPGGSSAHSHLIIKR